MGIVQPMGSCFNQCEDSCCLGTMVKKTSETIAIKIDWIHAFEGISSVSSVDAIVSDAAGNPLSVNAENLVIDQNKAESLRTIVVVSKGIAGSDYRVTVTASLNTCGGIVETLEECVLVSVKDC